MHCAVVQNPWEAALSSRGSSLAVLAWLRMAAVSSRRAMRFASVAFLASVTLGNQVLHLGRQDQVADGEHSSGRGNRGNGAAAGRTETNSLRQGAGDGSVLLQSH